MIVAICAGKISLKTSVPAKRSSWFVAGLWGAFLAVFSLSFGAATHYAHIHAAGCDLPICVGCESKETTAHAHGAGKHHPAADKHNQDHSQHDPTHCPLCRAISSVSSFYLTSLHCPLICCLESTTFPGPSNRALPCPLFLSNPFTRAPPKHTCSGAA